MIVRVFEVEYSDELVISIEEYPIQNESFVNLKKKSKKLTKLISSSLKTLESKAHTFSKCHTSLQETIKEFELSLSKKVQAESALASLMKKIKPTINFLSLESILLENRIFSTE